MPFQEQGGASGVPGTKMQYYRRRLTAMDQERSPFTDHWRELSDYGHPVRGRFFTSDRNKGNKRYTNIINSKALHALQIARSGMLSGGLPKTRPWFNFETIDERLMEDPQVRLWLHNVEKLIRRILSDSNFYEQAAIMLSDLILFGTGAMLHVDDFEDVARFYAVPVGSYYISQNDRYVVDTLAREFEWTAGQMELAFGRKNLSPQVRTAIDNGQPDKWFRVVHFIEPNDKFDGGSGPQSRLSTRRRFASVYFEPGHNDDKFLREGGFDQFPAYVVRWDTTAEDIYGTDCPGMAALGDIKALQLEEKRKSQALDKMVSPPLRGPAALRNVPISSLPGHLNLYEGSDQQMKLSPVYEVKPDLNALREDMNAIERRIERLFFNDLFQAISNIEGIQPRNQLDLIQRKEESLTQLGPVLERLHGEFLKPLLERVFQQTVKSDILPPPPPSLEGAQVDVKFISNLAMAQRAIDTQVIDRLSAFVGGLSEVNPSVLDKYDMDQAIDEYARALGAPPKLVKGDEQVQAERQQRAQMEQAAQAAEVAKNAATAGKIAAEGQQVAEDG